MVNDQNVTEQDLVGLKAFEIPQGGEPKCFDSDSFLEKQRLAWIREKEAQMAEMKFRDEEEQARRKQEEIKKAEEQRLLREKYENEKDRISGQNKIASMSAMGLAVWCQPL